jgi:hypothetical protein
MRKELKSSGNKSEANVKFADWCMRMAMGKVSSQNALFLTNEYRERAEGMARALAARDYANSPLDRKIKGASPTDIDRQFLALLLKGSWARKGNVCYKNDMEVVEYQTVTARMTFGNRLYGEPSVSSEESSGDDRERFPIAVAKDSRETRAAMARVVISYILNATAFDVRKKADGKREWFNIRTREAMTSAEWSDIQRACQVAVQQGRHNVAAMSSTQEAKQKPKSQEEAIHNFIEEEIKMGYDAEMRKRGWHRSGNKVLDRSNRPLQGLDLMTFQSLEDDMRDAWKAWRGKMGTGVAGNVAGWKKGGSKVKSSKKKHAAVVDVVVAADSSSSSSGKRKAATKAESAVNPTPVVPSTEKVRVDTTSPREAAHRRQPTVAPTLPLFSPTTTEASPPYASPSDPERSDNDDFLRLAELQKTPKKYAKTNAEEVLSKTHKVVVKSTDPSRASGKNRHSLGGNGKETGGPRQRKIHSHGERHGAETMPKAARVGRHVSTTNPPPQIAASFVAPAPRHSKAPTQRLPQEEDFTSLVPTGGDVAKAAGSGAMQTTTLPTPLSEPQVQATLSEPQKAKDSQQPRAVVHGAAQTPNTTGGSAVQRLKESQRPAPALPLTAARPESVSAKKVVPISTAESGKLPRPSASASPGVIENSETAPASSRLARLRAIHTPPVKNAHKSSRSKAPDAIQSVTMPRMRPPPIQWGDMPIAEDAVRIQGPADSPTSPKFSHASSSTRAGQEARTQPSRQTPQPSSQPQPPFPEEGFYNNQPTYMMPHLIPPPMLPGPYDMSMMPGYSGYAQAPPHMVGGNIIDYHPGHYDAFVNPSMGHIASQQPSVPAPTELDPEGGGWRSPSGTWYPPGTQNKNTPVR